MARAGDPLWPISARVSLLTRRIDGDDSALRVSGAGGGRRFASAISQALMQIGVTAADGTASMDGTGNTSSDASTNATEDSQQAEQEFVQVLFGAPQSQNSNAAQGSDATPKVGGGHHHHGGCVSKMESGLQNLIKQLTAGSGAGGATSAVMAMAMATTTDSSALLAQQTSFDSLVAASGGTGRTAILTSFLQNLAQNMQGTLSSGNVVSTKA